MVFDKVSDNVSKEVLLSQNPSKIKQLMIAESLVSCCGQKNTYFIG